MRIKYKRNYKSRRMKIGLLLTAILTVSMLGGCGNITSSGSPNNAATAPGSSLPPYQNSAITRPAFTPTAARNNATPLSQNNKGHVGPASLYPNPELTPGDVFPGVTSREVCVSGYSKSVRAVSSEEKALAYQRYGLTNTPGQHEVDHFISLELGGSNDIKNLWPEPYEPRPGAHEKDTVENALHAEVCAGRMALSQAQTIISQDWYAYYLKVKG